MTPESPYIAGSARSLVIYCVLAGTFNFYRGLYIVLLAWTALTVGDELASVGQIFVASHIVYIVFGPGVGSVVDHLTNRKAVVIGQLLLIAGALGPPLILAFSGELLFLHLIMTAAIGALGNLISMGALDRLFQMIVEQRSRRSASAIVGGIRQGGMVLGAGGGGFLIHHAGLSLSFVAAAVASLLVGLAVFALPGAPAPLSRTGGYAAHLKNIRDGFHYVVRTEAIPMLLFGTALAFSAGQLSNALLPAFIRDDIGQGSDLYGTVDAAWSVGGVAAAFAVGVWLRRASLNNAEYVFLSFLGVATVAFAQMQNPLSLIVFHCLMGALFSLSRVLCDGHLLEVCDSNMMARVRANIQAVTSCFGLAIYMAPTFFTTISARELYSYWGFFLACSGLALLVWRKRSAKTIQA